MASIRSGIGEFQSTLPREERLFHNCFEHVFNYFNPRSHERSDSSRRSNHKCKANFNPRSHERSDTRPSPHPWCRLRISIHAPTRGATRSSSSTFRLLLFQSTLPREERLGSQNMVDTSTLISIHAPTRGATFSFASASGSVRFQSTLPREERRKILRLFCRNMPFQSTLPREERLNT